MTCFSVLGYMNRFNSRLMIVLDPPRYRLMVKPAEFGLRRLEGEMSHAPFLDKAKVTDAAAFQAVAPLQV